MPSVTTRNPVVGRVFANLLLGTFVDAPADPLADTATIHLSQDPSFNPQPGDAPADYVAGEANFTGYSNAGVAADWSTQIAPSPVATALSASALWVVGTGSPTVGNTITGYWIKMGSNLVAAEKFAPGLEVQLGSPGAYLDLLALFLLELQPTA